MDPDTLVASEIGFPAILTVATIVVVVAYGSENLSRTSQRIAIADG